MPEVIQMGRKHWENVKLLITSNFSFAQSVFKRLVLQTPKKQGLIGRRLRFTRMCEQEIRLRRGRLLLLCRQNTEGE